MLKSKFRADSKKLSEIKSIATSSSLEMMSFKARAMKRPLRKKEKEEGEEVKNFLITYLKNFEYVKKDSYENTESSSASSITPRDETNKRTFLRNKSYFSQIPERINDRSSTINKTEQPMVRSNLVPGFRETMEDAGGRALPTNKNFLTPQEPRRKSFQSKGQFLGINQQKLEISDQRPNEQILNFFKFKEEDCA